MTREGKSLEMDRVRCFLRPGLIKVWVIVLESVSSSISFSLSSSVKSVFLIFKLFRFFSVYFVFFLLCVNFFSH